MLRYGAAWLLLHLLISLHAVSSTTASSINLLPPRQDASLPQIQNFVRYFIHTSFVLGDTLYVDGGEFTTTDLQLGPQINNWTYAIDLSQTFSTDKSKNPNPPTFRTIRKGDCPSFAFSGSWVNGMKQEAYIWGGEYDVMHEWVGVTTVPPESLWALTNENGGTWKNIPENYDPVFSSLTRATWGTSTYGPNAGGFSLGGWSGKLNSPKTDSDGYEAAYGLYFYNFHNQSWSNFSTSGLYDGTYFGAAPGGSQFVPNLGAAGLLLVFGGQKYDSTFLLGEPYPWDNITVFDLATQNWYSQPTTGDHPQTGKMRFCNVGKESPDGSYEVFLYGGTGEDPAIAQAESDAIHILSLPAFHWLKTDATSGDPRWGHTCNVAGNRQMLCVGGTNPLLSDEPDPDNPLVDQQTNTSDPFVAGIKIFDLTALSWTNTFDPSDKPYEAPRIIQDYYNGTMKYPSRWEDAELGRIIMSRSVNGTGSPGANNTSSTGDANNTSSPTSPTEENDTGAIVGGVVGAIVGLVAVAGVIWWLCIRQPKQRRAKIEKGHLSSQKSPFELDSPPDRGKHELGEGSFSPVGKAELGSREEHELGQGWLSNEGRAELASTPAHIK